MCFRERKGDREREIPRKKGSSTWAPMCTQYKEYSFARPHNILLLYLDPFLKFRTRCIERHFIFFSFFEYFFRVESRRNENEKK